MDDRTTGVGGERMTGLGDEGAIGRADEVTSRRRTSTTGASDRTRNRAEERTRPGASVVDRGEDTGQRTEQIRAEIEQTREDMSETIDAIQDRLRPRNVAAQAMNGVRDAASATVDQVRDAASDAMDEVAESRVVRQIRSNPVPAVMIGVGVVGLAWLAFGRNDETRRRHGRTEVYDHGDSLGYYEERDNYYRNADAAETSLSDVASGIRSTAASAGAYGDQVGTRVRHQTRRAQSQLQRALHENPLAVGAAALAVGAIIGMALPETERENELLGEARDNMVEGAQEMARTAAARVQNAASEAAKHVQNVATDPDTLLK